MNAVESISHPGRALHDRHPIDWTAVAHDLTGLNLITAPGTRKRLSRDFHWYSPILTAQLADRVADLVVKVGTEDDVRQVCAVAAKWKLPLTVRAGGTGNYGQCVPLGTSPRSGASSRADSAASARYATASCAIRATCCAPAS